MNDGQVSQPAPQSANRAVGGRKVGRRSVMKAGVATVAGLALGANYVGPGVTSVEVKAVYAFSIPETTQELDPPDGKVAPAAKKEKQEKKEKKENPGNSPA